MEHAKFVHLHVHTEYSLLDGACRIPNLVEKAFAYRMPALAITDHGNMHGVIGFYTKAMESGVKPIIGCEVYVARGSMREKAAPHGKDAIHHLVLLAENEEGYRNLMKLVSHAHLEGFYYKPRIDKELLGQYAKGLIGLSSCLKGEVASLCLDGHRDRARRVAEAYREILGNGSFYLELQDNGLPEQKRVNRDIVALSRETGIPLVATSDFHYLDKEDAEAHDVLLCIQTGKTLFDEKRMKFSSPDFYMKSPEEMTALFAEIPEAIEATVRIAERCNVEIACDGKHLHLPRFPLPEGEHDKLAYFNRLCEKGFRWRYPKGNDAARGRLVDEARMIQKMRFVDYFLIVWDFIRYAKEREIPVGPGRGSAAGSVVAYCLGITDIEPVRYNLLFERFLNPDRINMPDIDIDFCYDRRDEVIEYVIRRYGRERVAQIITFGTMGAKAVIRDVGRVLGMPYGEVDRLAKLVPLGVNVKLRAAVESEPQLADLIKSDERVARLFRLAYRLEGLCRNASTHAAGIVIAERDLTDFVPLCRGTNGEIVTQYSMYPIEKIGLLKMDFLGLKTLTVLHNTIRIIERTQHKNLDLNEVPLDDPGSFSLLNKANTVGVFQLESPGMRDLSKRLGLSRFEDLLALVALFRPGPMHMLDDFVKRKHGKLKVRYDHPQLEPIMKETYGVMLYQEQVMQAANVLAGFSMSEADTLRRIMGKKIRELMPKQRQRFIDGCLKNKIPKKIAAKIFEDMSYFAGYGFNKSHSAAYALISYHTAFFKANYPVEYMAALLSSEMSNTDKITKYIDECKEMGIPVLAPDVNESFSRFTVVGGGIRFGLAAVKNVGQGAVQSICRSREEGGKFTSLYDFAKRVDLRLVNRKVMESLIRCGAFNSLGVRRAQLMASLDRILEAASRAQKDREVGQSTLFEMIPEESALGLDALPDVAEWPESRLLAFEKELLGFYVTGHPLTEYEKVLSRYVTRTTRGLAEAVEGEEVKIGGIISAATRKLTKKSGERMAILQLEDLEGAVEVLVFPKVYREFWQMIEAGRAVFVVGRVNGSEEEKKVVAKSFLPLDAVRQAMTQDIHIRLATASVTKDTLASLKGILANHGGTCPVYMDFSFTTGERVLMQAGNGLRVDPCEELIALVEDLLGENTVWLNTK